MIDQSRMQATALALRAELAPIIEAERSVEYKDVLRASQRLYYRWMKGGHKGTPPVTFSSPTSKVAIELADAVASF